MMGLIIKLIVIIIGLMITLIRLNKIIMIIIIIEAVSFEQDHGGSRWSAAMDPDRAAGL